MGRPRINIRPTPVIRKAAGQMRKLLGLWENSKREKAKTPLGNNANPRPMAKEGNPQFLTASQGLQTGFITRRQIVLNRHFTEIISDVLANNLRGELSRLGINITSIETKAWNKGVDIFYSPGKPFDDTTHRDLNSLVGQLRFAITERGLIGRTPPLNFVYDEASELNRTIEEALKDVEIKKPPDETCLTQNKGKELWANKSLGFKDSTLVSNRFSAPVDMNNMTLGLDYPSLYNEVVAKLERSRGESSRMAPNISLLSTRPLMRAPIEDCGEDPATRIARMQKFLVNQKKKKEYLAKVRRKQELLYREGVRWEWPDEEGETERIEEEIKSQ